GTTWTAANLMQPVLPKTHVRFRLPWVWDGQPRLIMSRAVDDTGAIQPSRQALLSARGRDYIYHYNGIQPWLVQADGNVTNAMGATPSSLPSGTQASEEYL